MGIKERQERDKEAVRGAILDAARDLFVSEGYANVSIRKIADRIEYSPAAIYGYFASKDDIFFALAEEGFRLLYGAEDAMAVLRDLSPLERIHAMLWRFYEYSKAHPQHFALMFIDRSMPRISREYERFAFARQTKQRLIAEVQACIDAGALPSTLEPAVAFRLLTTAILGVAVLRLSDRLAPGEDADALAGDVLNVTMAGLRAGLTLASMSVVCAIDAPEESPAAHD